MAAQSSLRVAAAVLVFLSLSILIARPFFAHRDDSIFRPSHRHKCNHKDPKPYHAPKKNLYSELTPDEAADILHFLYTVPNPLNLTKAANASTWDNKLEILEAWAPNKSSALAYLHGTEPAPPRYARAIVNQGSTPVPGLHQYMIGPLPCGSNTTITPLSFPYNSGRNYVNNPLPDYESIVAWFVSLGIQMPDMLQDLLGDAANPSHDPRIPDLMALSRPAAFHNGTVSSWASVHGPGLRHDAWSMLPQGVYFRFDITSRNPEDWKIYEWYYNGVLYKSTEAFYKAWKEGRIIKSPQNIDGEWTEAQPEEEGVEGRDAEAPVMIQPYDIRYKIDLEERFVSWMGFEFFLSSNQANALSLWDVKFKGERVMYELGLQEAMAHYAGNDPMQIGMVWLDTLFGMGYNMYELVPGYDCPQYATFLPTKFYRGDDTITRNNTICIFEYTADHPLQRHTTPLHLTISRNTYLVVRWVSTVGNYDYTFDYTFYLDGSFEVKVRASGYIFSSYHMLESARNEYEEKRSDEPYEYGYRVRDAVTTSMHDHVINFKADLDILGEQNTLYRVGVEPYTHQYQWEDYPRNTMKLNHSPITNETGLDWPANAGAMYIAFSEKKNGWGERRGYRITPGTGMGTPPHLTVRNSTALDKSSSWAYRDLWVLQQHDQERKSTSEYNGMEPEDPLIDFQKMVNNESVSGEDLVLYFNLGTHHVPNSGDIPNTLMHWSSSSVMFIPHNFHDRDPSRKSAQGVKLDMKEPGNGSNVTYFGAKYSERVKVEVEELEPDLSGYNAPESAFMENLNTKNVILDLVWNATGHDDKSEEGKMGQGELV